MKGAEQKETVLKFLTLAIKNAEFQEELEEEYLNMVKNGVMATTIDIIVEVDPAGDVATGTLEMWVYVS